MSSSSAAGSLVSSRRDLPTGSHECCSPSVRWRQRARWLADLPPVTERVDDLTEPPSVLVLDRREFLCALAHGRGYDALGVVHDEQQPPGCTAETVGTKALHFVVRALDPEPGAVDVELSHDVVAIADQVQHGRAECSLVERDRCTGAINPQLWLDAGHPSRVGRTLLSFAVRGRCAATCAQLGPLRDAVGVLGGGVVRRRYRVPSWSGARRSAVASS